METIKWFIINIPESSRKTFEKALLNMPFNDEVGEGFSIRKITRNEVCGTYIASKTFIKEVVTPHGETNVIKGVDYTTIEFRLSFEDLPILEIYSKPRTIKPLINLISSIVGFGFSVEEIDIDIDKFITKIESSLGGLSVQKIVISDLNIDDKALGNLTLTSDHDIRKVVENRLTIGRYYKISYIKAYFVSGIYYGGYIELDNKSKLTTHNLSYNKFKPDFLQTYLDFLSERI